MRKSNKLVASILCALLLFTLSGCVQSEAAKAMDEQINEIGEVTLDSISLIESAERAYLELEKADQKQVRNYRVLEDARTSYSKLRATEVDVAISKIGTVTLANGGTISLAEKAYNDLTEDEQQFVSEYETLVAARNTYTQLRADKVIDDINSIGKVDASSYRAIDDAERGYAALSDDEKALVTNYDKLKSAWIEYDKSCAAQIEKKIEEAVADTSMLDATEKAYQALTATQKEYVKNYDKLVDARIAYVIGLIDGLGEITLDSGEAIEAVEKEYQKLSTNEKNRVTNRGDIDAAKTRLEELEKEQKEKEKQALIKKMKEDKDKVAGVTRYISNSQPRYVNSRSFVLPYIVLTDGGVLGMRLQYVYAGKDWVFYRKAIIVTDTMKYTRPFTYYDIEHETALGANLCEYIDVVVDQDDLTMLRDIANSKEVTVRFEGDSKRSDFTMSSSDKQAIADMIALYTLLAEEKGVLAVSGK